MTRKLIGWLALVGSLAALNYSSRFTQGKPPPDTLYRYGTAISGVIFYVITLAIVLWIANGIPRGSSACAGRNRGRARSASCWPS